MRDPRSSLAETLKRELAARGLTQRWLAVNIGVAPTTLSRYLNGRRPLSSGRLAQILAALRHQGPFRFTELTEPGVMRGLQGLEGLRPSKGASSGASSSTDEIKPAAMHIDTLSLAFAVPVAKQSAVADRLRSAGAGPLDFKKFYDYRDYRHGVYIADGVGVWAPKKDDESRWAVLQFKPFVAGSGRQLAMDLRTLTAKGDDGTPASPLVLRLDLTLDYPAEPYWALVHRPRSRVEHRIQDEDGLTTWYEGRKGGRGSTVIRTYDAGRRHAGKQYVGRSMPPPTVSTPLMRVEAEWRPKRGQEPTLAEVAGRPGWSDGRNPFSGIEIFDLWAAGLDVVETSMLYAAQLKGLRWYRAQLTSEADRDRFERALQLAKAGCRFQEPAKAFEERRHHLEEWLVIQDLR